VRRKLALFPPQLLRMHAAFRPSSASDVAMWTAILVAFWGMVRKGDLLHEDLRASDLLVCERGAFVRLRRSKTIQFGDRQHILAFDAAISPHPLCAFWALKRHLQLNLLSAAPADTQLFANLSAAGGWTPITPPQFDACLKRLCRVTGLQHRQYSGHSLRRGGASTALEFGLSKEAIASIGDWRSAAIDCCLQAQLKTQRAASAALSDSLRRRFPVASL
jgi:hypothetical protein